MMDIPPAEQARIQRHRDEAFVDCLRPLWLSRWAPRVAVLTWRRVHHLSGEENPLLDFNISRWLLSRRALLRALYLCSPAFRPDGRGWRRFRLLHGWRVWVQRERIASGLRAYIREAFAEQLRGPQAAEFPAAHWLADRAVLFAGRGLIADWSGVLDMPVAVSNQLVNSIVGHRPSGSPAGEPAWNPAQDKANGEYLRRKKAARLKAQRNN